jgi:hypothetical protein
VKFIPSAVIAGLLKKQDRGDFRMPFGNRRSLVLLGVLHLCTSRGSRVIWPLFLDAA